MSNGKQKTAVIYSDWKDLIEEISNEDAGIIFKNLLRMLDNEMMLDEPSERVYGGLLPKNSARESKNGAKSQEQIHA